MILSGEELANAERLCYNSPAMRIQKTTKMQEWVGIALAVIGLVSGVWGSGLSVWAQLEANLFDVGRPREGTLPLDCPRFIAQGETAYARARLENPTDKPRKYSVITHISAGHVTLMYEESQIVSVPAGEEIALSWPVSSTEAAYHGRMIFVRTFVPSYVQQSPVSNVCGVYVVRTPFGWKGDSFMVGVAVFSALVMWGGAWLWWRVPASAFWRRRRAAVFALLLMLTLAWPVVWWGYTFFAALLLLVAGLILLALFSSVMERG